MAVKAPIVDGKYSLLRKLGAGGMAEVFLAKQVSEGNFEKLVVIKRILPHLAAGATNNDFVAMFLDEARLASDLRHPNVVTVIDVGKTSETYYIVMEFLHGQDVRKMQRKNAAWAEQIPLGHCCQIAIDAAAGLHYAHNKKDLDGRPLSIVHRDVSPQNIIITYEGGTKIVDFGIAKAASQTTHTSTGVLKGKYTYMSPEQASGLGVDARTDQFALGIVLWELLTMRRLFKRDTEMLTLEAIMYGQVPRPSRFRPDLPKSIDDIVMRALARDRNERFEDCEQMALAIEDALASEGVVHSQSRLSQYMRRLFADTLAEEATLGLVNPDGSLSRNLTPFTLPPSVAGAPAAAAEPAPPTQPTPDATTADRKSARSKDESAAKHDRSREASFEPLPSPASQAATVTHDTQRDSDPPRSRDRWRSRDRDMVRDHTFRDRVIAARPVIAIVAALLIAAGVIYALASAQAAFNASGPGTLVIRSEPRGATVVFDDVDTGQRTPALLRDVPAGKPHKVRVELPGRAPVEEVVTIEKRGQTLELKLDIPAVPP